MVRIDTRHVTILRTRHHIGDGAPTALGGGAPSLLRSCSRGPPYSRWLARARAGCGIHCHAASISARSHLIFGRAHSGRIAHRRSRGWRQCTVRCGPLGGGHSDKLHLSRTDLRGGWCQLCGCRDRQVSYAPRIRSRVHCPWVLRHSSRVCRGQPHERAASGSRIVDSCHPRCAPRPLLGHERFRRPMALWAYPPSSRC